MQPEQNSMREKAFDALRAAGLRPPKTLTVAVTAACNLRCVHCWVDAAPTPSSGHVAASALRRLLAEFAALGGENVCFTGGEPLCHPQWGKLLGHARHLGFAGISLQTNGALLGAAAVAVLRQLNFPGLSVQVSLDGGTAATHDRVRGTGAYSEVLGGLRRLVDGGLAPRLTLFFTEMRHNLEELPLILELAEELGAAAVVSGALVSCGRAASGSPVQPAEPGQYAQLVARYDADPRFRQLYRKLGTTASLEWRQERAGPPGCCSLVEKLYLTPHGLLYPCVMCHADDFAVAGLFEKGLAAALLQGAPLWSSLQRISRRRAAGNAGCRECPAIDACAGGCMGRAWGSSGNLLAADDRCEARKIVCRGKSSPPPNP